MEYVFCLSSLERQVSGRKRCVTTLTRARKTVDKGSVEDETWLCASGGNQRAKRELAIELLFHHPYPMCHPSFMAGVVLAGGPVVDFTYEILLANIFE